MIGNAVELVDRPRLLFINRSYWPDVEATGQLLTELCEDLAGEFCITVICGRPSRVVENISPSATLQTEQNGVIIRRVWHTRFNKSSFAGRLLNMLSFQWSATWSAFRCAQPDIVIVETDPPFLCLLGRALQLFRRTRLVCYLQDIYPDIAVALGKIKPGLVTGVLRRIFFRVYRCSDAVIVLSRDMRDLLLEEQVRDSRLHIISNWVDTARVHPIKLNNRFRCEGGLEGKFVVMYSGNLGLSQKLTYVLDAAEKLCNDESIVFAFVGDGADRPKLEAIARERKLPNVRFYDYQPKSELASSLSAADVHLVILQSHIQRLLMPSKFYGVLASGTPAVAIATGNCELAEIIRENNLGCVIGGHDAGELADRVKCLATSPDCLIEQSKNARKYAEAHCTRHASVARLCDLFISLLERREHRQSDSQRVLGAGVSCAKTVMGVPGR